jgi:hypothetical protein
MSDKTRRNVGAGLGLLIGLIYGAAGGLINAWVLPGIPLRVELGRVLADTIFVGVGALAAGYVTAWSRSTFTGILIGAAAIAGFLTLRAIFAQANGLERFFRIIIILIPVFLPSLALSLPITGLLRWGVHLYDDALSYSGRPRLFRLGRLSVGVLGLGLMAGSLSLMPADQQAALKQVNTLIKNGLAAGSDAEVPHPLQHITAFRDRATGPYTLDRRIDVSRDITFADATAIQTIQVDVLFENGLHFECLIGQSLAEPLCTEQ